MKKFLVGALVAFAALYASLWTYTGYVRAGVTCTLPFNLQNNTVADATQVMANYNQLVTCLGNAAAAGSNSDITALLGLTTPLVYTAGGSSVYIGGTTTGSANAQVLANPTPNGFSLTVGKRVVFSPGFTNLATTSETTLNVNGLGAVNIHQQTPAGNTRLFGGELTGQLTEVVYDGVEYLLVANGGQQFGGFGPRTVITAAATTDLGSIPGHSVLVNGNTGITSFGSSASTTYPIYIVDFGGTPIITNDGTSLQLPGNANIQVASGDRAIFEYVGSGNWRTISYTKLTGTAVVNPTPLPGFLGLSIKNNAGTPDTQIDIAYTNAVLINPTGNVPNFVTSGSFTINLTNGTVTSACNAMDGEARGTSNWLYVYIISDGTTPCALATLTQPTPSPTMPTNYIYRAYAGAMRVDGAGKLTRTRQIGNLTRRVVSQGFYLTGLASANVGGVWTAIAMGAVVPPTATVASVLVGTNSVNSPIAVAPNGSFATTLGASGVPCIAPFTAGSSTTAFWACDILLESTNIFYENNSTNNGVYEYGWKDAVNAN